MKYLLLAVAIFLQILALPAQSPGEMLEAFSATHSPEKVYVSHDKPSYTPGDTLWSTVFVVDARTHLAFAGTPLVYVDWIDPAGRLLRSWTLQTKDGTAELDIPTSRKDTTGNYVLRAYTNFQRNFDPGYRFQKEVRLLNFREEETVTETTSSGLKIEFFPEGGHLVAGLENSVGFIARDARGRSRNVSATLITEGGRKVGSLLTLNDGMGVFPLQPVAGERYFARVKEGEETVDFPLPAALPDGYLLHGSSRSPEQLKLEMSTNVPTGLNGSRLVGHLRGMVFLDQELTGAASQSLLLAKADLPSGVLHFTLFDAKQRPVAERLLFNKNPTETVGAKITADREAYVGRQRVNLTCAVPASSRYTLSVFAADLLEENDGQLDVVNYLWLQSDLDGYVNNPAQYFRDDSPRTSTLLDLLLMVRGWRKFNWLDVLAGKQPTLTYPPEEHLSFSGKLRRYGKDVPQQGDISLNILSATNFTMQQLTTDEEGNYLFSGIDLTDTTDVLLQASTHNARQQAKRDEDELSRTGNSYINIRPALPDTPAYRPALSFPALSASTAGLRRFAYEVANKRAATATDFADLSVDLETVTVTTGLNRAQLREQEIEQRYDEKEVFYFGGTTKFRADDPQFDGFKKDNIFRLVALVVPLAYYKPKGGLPSIIYGSPTNGNTPTFVLDGRIVNVSTLATIHPEDIAVIEVIDDMKALHYVNKGMVIQLLRKRPEEITRERPGMLSFTHPGYYQARTFFSPTYPVAEETSDFRTTLFWSGAVMAKEPKDFTFYTGDRPGQYLVRVEGITENGLPFTGLQTIQIE